MGIIEAIERSGAARKLFAGERRASVVRKVHPAHLACCARCGVAYDVEAAYGQARPRVRHARACPPSLHERPFPINRACRRIPDWSFLAYTPATEAMRERSRSLWRGLPPQQNR